MFEKLVRLQDPNNVFDRTLVYPMMVCTDDWIFAFSRGSLNSLGGLYAYSVARNDWQVLGHNGLPPNFAHGKMLIFGRQSLIIHGMLDDVTNDGTFKTYIGKFTERPIQFKLIGTLVITKSDCHYNIVTDGDHLYSITLLSADTKMPKLTVHRLNPANNWEVVSSTECQDRIMETMFVYNHILYIFCVNPYPTVINGSKLIAVDLKTGRRTSLALQPVEGGVAGYGPQQGFPMAYPAIKNFSVVQCPAEPGNVYLMFGNNLFASTMEFWRLDTAAAQWHKLPHLDVGPTALGNARIASAISPSGRLYMLRSSQVHQCDLFRTSVRVPRLTDECMDLVVEQMRNDDPGWMPARTVQNVLEWAAPREDEESP